MEIKKTIRSKNKEVDAYIEELESWIENFEASNIKKLIVAVDSVAGIIADDIIMLKEKGDDDEIDNKLQMLGSKKNKIYQRYRDVISDIKHFKLTSDILNELKPNTSSKEIKSVTGDVIETTGKKPLNISDLAFSRQKT